MGRELQKLMRQELAYLRTQLRAYQHIVAECLAVAHGVPLDRIGDYLPPPVEIGVDHSNAEVAQRVREWWQARLGESDGRDAARDFPEDFARALHEANELRMQWIGWPNYDVRTWDELTPVERRDYQRAAEMFPGVMPRRRDKRTAHE